MQHQPHILTPTDWQKFKAIRLRGWATDPISFGGSREQEEIGESEYWTKRLVDPKRFYMAIEKGDTFISMAGVICTPDRGWMLVGVYTVPEARGKGLAKQIVQACLEEAKSRGATTMTLYVNNEQVPALNLYTKLGFKMVRIEKGEVMGDGLVHDEYVME